MSAVEQPEEDRASDNLSSKSSSETKSMDGSSSTPPTITQASQPQNSSAVDKATAAQGGTWKKRLRGRMSTACRGTHQSIKTKGGDRDVCVCMPVVNGSDSRPFDLVRLSEEEEEAIEQLKWSISSFSTGSSPSSFNLNHSWSAHPADGLKAPLVRRSAA